MIEINGTSPTVHERAWVAPGAVLSGAVTIEEDASVWYTCVLRADMEPITIGARSNVQDGTVVHTDPGFPVSIGDGVTIGHRAVVHGCTIGDDVLIGMGAVVMNGCTIGAGSLVAAGAVLTQGLQVPPGSLVAGVPGKVRREISDDERTMLDVSSAAYVHYKGLHDDATR
ncbi:gamma carbonic anhydrase family protein [Pseudonocardia endophytica]|uniref:Carbonic anhydrase/acetyltransferase-like protein (Isoleucine patch superfamily) n=1 Tax=Pseudonocardia endophytica TaxID=401976 RepID=A0A4R1HRS3_PSEEN|nr:gamma carbonic anhydrase family protein [Pseudonocardia endophytica]TCK22509.1 carbonic anhydrase/acetyltransferase-like protein (isoleucine patch superfamily) [Pseudonocardia endophytica]